MCYFPEKTKDVYDYIATFVDDLRAIVADPEHFLEELKSNSVYDFKLKGSGEVKFHLGCGFVCESSGTLCMEQVDMLILTRCVIIITNPFLDHTTYLQEKQTSIGNL